MLYENSWSIRLIAALLLTFMSQIRLVRSLQVGFGGLSPPKQCTKAPKLKYENYKWVDFIFTMTRHQQGNKKLTLIITSGDFHPKLTLTIMSGDFHPNSQSAVTSGEFHLRTTWPLLLSGWKSPGLLFQGCKQSLQKTWKWLIQTSVHYRW